MRLIQYSVVKTAKMNGFHSALIIDCPNPTKFSIQTSTPNFKQFAYWNAYHPELRNHTTGAETNQSSNSLSVKHSFMRNHVASYIT